MTQVRSGEALELTKVFRSGQIKPRNPFLPFWISLLSQVVTPVSTYVLQFFVEACKL